MVFCQVFFVSSCLRGAKSLDRHAEARRRTLAPYPAGTSLLGYHRRDIRERLKIAVEGDDLVAIF
jgi:hypothetical protein